MSSHYTNQNMAFLHWSNERNFQAETDTNTHVQKQSEHWFVEQEEITQTNPTSKKSKNNKDSPTSP